MKKSAIVLAVAAGLGVSAAQAVTTLYGSARVSVNFIAENIREEDDLHAELVNNSSRLGVRGSEDLGNGLSAIYRYEFGVNPVTDAGGAYFNSDRPRFVGLEGPFGTLRFGAMFTPEYEVTGLIDIFNGSMSAIASSTSFRIGNQIRYDSPSFGGFVLSGAVSVRGFEDDPDTDDEEFIDRFNIAGVFSSGPIIAGATYYQDSGADETGKRWAVNVGYDAGPFGVGFVYERGNFFGDSSSGTASVPTVADVSLNDSNFEEGDDYFNIFQLAADYSFGNSTVRGYVAYQLYDDDDTAWFVGSDGVDDPQEEDALLFWALGFQHNLSRRTRVWAEYGGRNEPDTLHTVSIGIRHDF
ncbi:MAG: porin [Candidatus Competibacterales bacterium]